MRIKLAIAAVLMLAANGAIFKADAYNCRQTCQWVFNQYQCNTYCY